MCYKPMVAPAPPRSLVALSRWVLALEKIREAGKIDVLPIDDYVAAISVGIVGGQPMTDLAYEEDSQADVDMNVVKTGAGRFIEVQGTAEGSPFGHDALNQLLDLADTSITHLVTLQREIVGASLAHLNTPA